jgi:DNA-binding transcriptional ArsR family regulator
MLLPVSSSLAELAPLGYCSSSIVHISSIEVKQLAHTGSPPEDHTPDLADVDVLTVLQALSDPVRLAIVRQLAGCDADLGLMCGQITLPVTKSTASHHLKTLHNAGLTTERAQGVCKYIQLRRDELNERFPGLLESVLSAAATPVS